MKTKKQIALNKLFNVCVITGLFFGYGAIVFFKERERGFGLMFGVIALLLTVLPAIFTPFCYVFDGEGVSFLYVLSPVERYLWKDVYAIEVEDTSTGRPSVLDLLYANVFAISGNSAGKRRPYMTGHIRKSFRTKRLLEKYWDGQITGYFFEDIKEAVGKHKEATGKKKAKKQARVSAQITDETVAMEREVRAETRECLKAFEERANANGLEMKANYLYVTEDFDEFTSRPDEGYTYTLSIEIARFGETDEGRIAVFEMELLRVRLGKTAYRGVKIKGACAELEKSLADALDEIIKNGIVAYCEDI